MTAKPKTTYVTASPQTWELVRAGYLSGLSASTAAARFGVSVAALRKRARREGWTKTAFAQAGQRLAPRAVSDSAATAKRPDLMDRAIPPIRLSTQSVARRALEQAAHALSAGRPSEAAACARAAQAIAQLADLVPLFDGQETPEEAEARHAMLKESVHEMAMDLAQRLVDGAPLPNNFADAADAWRARRRDGPDRS